MRENYLIKNYKTSLLLFISCLVLGLFCTSFSGAYWYEFYYKIRVVDAEGEIIVGKEFTIQIEDTTSILKTDSLGVLSIYLGGTENCTSNSHSKRIKDWSWTPSSLFIVTNDNKIDINKNWKKHFRKEERKIDIYDFESGELSCKKIK